jgi:hypothetical protein
MQFRMGLDAAKFPVNFYTLYLQRKLRWLGHLMRSNILHGLSKFIPANYWGDMSPEDVAIMAHDRPRWEAFVSRMAKGP